MDLAMAMPTETSTGCRFCFAAKSYTDVTLHQDSDQSEPDYAVMLKDTFNVEIAHRATASVACLSCIGKLLAAHEFKQLVLHSEQRFADILRQYEDKTSTQAIRRSSRNRAKIMPVSSLAPTLKLEDDLHFHDEASVDECSGDDETRVVVQNAPAAVERRRRRKRKPCDVTSAKMMKLDPDNGVDMEEKAAGAPDWKKLADRRGNAPILRENSLKLLANSTMCIFQWHKSRYRCFCCNEPFADMDTLREHTRNAHTLKNIEKKIILQQNRLVKVEISSLDCKVCGRTLLNIGDLKQHLVKEHNVDFTLKEDLLVPFKLDTDSLQCQVCAETFSVFRHLNIHMNRHYQKQVCHICGAGFSNLVYLNLHKTRSHKPLKCNECQIEFCTRGSKRDHDSAIHNVKVERKLRFPCPFCSERYFQEHLRILHLVEKHGMEKPEHRCSICGKVYVTKSLRNNHLKNVHLKQKNRECDVCHLRFYTRSDLKRHKVTHTGEKNFACATCNNLYATKDSLNRHVKRTHVN